MKPFPTCYDRQRTGMAECQEKSVFASPILGILTHRIRQVLNLIKNDANVYYL